MNVDVTSRMCAAETAIKDIGDIDLHVERHTAYDDVKVHVGYGDRDDPPGEGVGVFAVDARLGRLLPFEVMFEDGMPWYSFRMM